MGQDWASLKTMHYICNKSTFVFIPLKTLRLISELRNLKIVFHSKTCQWNISKSPDPDGRFGEHRGGDRRGLSQMPPLPVWLLQHVLFSISLFSAAPSLQSIWLQNNAESDWQRSRSGFHAPGEISGESQSGPFFEPWVLLTACRACGLSLQCFPKETLNSRKSLLRSHRFNSLHWITITKK